MTGKQLQRVRTERISEVVEDVYNGDQRALRIIVEGMNQSERDRLFDVVDDFAWLIPTWCHRLFIDFDVPENGATATASSNPDYRQACIKIREDFFTHTPDYQRRIICHELLHIINAPIQDNTRTLLLELTEKADPTMRDIFIRMMTEWVEQATSDLENAICERMESAMIERRGTPARKKPTTKRARAK